MSRRRPSNQLRPTRIERYTTAAAGGVRITQGNTQVLCTASIAKDVPPWLIDRHTGEASRGWITAEYAMLPGSTPDRKRRGTDSRSTEIQRLIGRALRAGVDLEKMPGLMITCDCDVLIADGGTRTAAITGAYVALAQAIAHARNQKMIKKNPIKGPIAAISVGIIDGQPQLDLDYTLDVRAEVDMNIAMNHKGDYVEIQGTAEAATFTRKQLDQMLALATRGIRKLMPLQRAVLRQG